MNAAALEALIAPWDQPGQPGGVVAASRGDRAVMARPFGLASVEYGVANTPATRFPIGSVTKHITGAALLALEDEARWRLDEGVRRWLPELPLLRGEPTLRQLAEHRGGYRCYLDIGFCDGFAMQPAGAGLGMQRRQRDANFAPGTSQRYSNGGYLLLSLAIERATGQRFEEVLHSRLFAPLGLAHTESVRCDAPLRAGLATGHVPWPGGGWARGLNVSEERLGDGSVVSTAGDMLRWAAHVRRSGLLDRLAPQRDHLEAVDAVPRIYGLGLLEEHHRGLRLLGHGGGVMGANGQLFWVPEHELEVVALCNGPAPARAIALAAVEGLLAEHLADAAEPVPAAIFVGRRGHYRVPETGMVFELADAPEGLSIGLFGAAPAPALRYAPDAVDGETLPFVMPGATHPFGFRIRDGELWMTDAGVPLRAEPLDPALPAPSGARLGGRYRCEDAGAELELRATGSGIVAHGRGPWGHNRFEVAPMAGGLLAMRHAWMPWHAVAAPQAQGNLVDALTISTARTRALVFERCA